MPRGTAGAGTPAWQRRASRTYEPVELLEPGLDGLPELPELPGLRWLPEALPMWVQWCVPADAGMLPAWLVPADVDAGGDDDVPGDADDEVVDVVDVTAVVPAPPVDASATPVTPAPTPAAATPVMMSRRARPPILETIRSSLRTASRVVRPARLSGTSVRRGTIRRPWPGSQGTMTYRRRLTGAVAEAASCLQAQMHAHGLVKLGHDRKRQAAHAAADALNGHRPDLLRLSLRIARQPCLSGRK